MPEHPLRRIWSELDTEPSPATVWCRGIEGSRVVVLLGAFDPPTRAHVKLVLAAARACDAPGAFCLTKVLLARPPEELLDPVQRLALLDELAADHGFGVVVANRGTYLDVHRVLRAADIEATFVVGSDKLAQLADPSFYPDGQAGVDATFSEVRLLVVPRPGSTVDRRGVAVLDAADVFDDPVEESISSTEVRRRVRAGESVEALVPPGVARSLEGYTAAR